MSKGHIEKGCILHSLFLKNNRQGYNQTVKEL